ncbi:MAG: asparagine synthetase B, partial [Armatimonadetes bacterium CG_4_9_14_3_um_filter_66_14]
MCGIHGLWHLDGRPADLARLRAAATAMRHRGPDDEGYLLADTRARRLVTCGGSDTDQRLALPEMEAFSGERFDLAFAHRRLSILDLSPAGHQPMASADGDLWIAYNGEVYNYLELRDELRAAGHVFSTGTDTEVLLAAYRAWGADCLSRFNGMWAFALWDAANDTLFCARDRFGIKPFYYYWDGTTFVFASEPKALLEHPAVPKRPNTGVIYDY